MMYLVRVNIDRTLMYLDSHRAHLQKIFTEKKTRTLRRCPVSQGKGSVDVYYKHLQQQEQFQVTNKQLILEWPIQLLALFALHMLLQLKFILSFSKIGVWHWYQFLNSLESDTRDRTCFGSHDSSWTKHWEIKEINKQIETRYENKRWYNCFQ